MGHVAYSTGDTEVNKRDVSLLYYLCCIIYNAAKKKRLKYELHNC